MRRLILAAAFAAASASFAFSPAFASDDGFAADPGVNDIGVDIAGVPLTPAGVHAFMASQNPELRREIQGACRTYSAHPESGAGEQSLAFCAELGKTA